MRAQSVPYGIVIAVGPEQTGISRGFETLHADYRGSHIVGFFSFQESFPPAIDTLLSLDRQPSEWGRAPIYA